MESTSASPDFFRGILRRYFYSGWAFLHVPYLVFYLLYYWRK